MPHSAKHLELFYHLEAHQEDTHSQGKPPLPGTSEYPLDSTRTPLNPKQEGGEGPGVREAHRHPPQEVSPTSQPASCLQGVGGPKRRGL